MAANCYADLMAHVGHELVCVTYAGGANVAVECETCHEVVLDFDRPPDGEPLFRVEWCVGYTVPASKVGETRQAVTDDVYNAVKLDSIGEVEKTITVTPAPGASWSDVPSWLIDEDEEDSEETDDDGF
ncbi:MAG: hypothetical protein FOGNACKC_00818 [Anaerolineae bacterium]|nr:hypothetical protein [Anaerolineae bacterium]